MFLKDVSLAESRPALSRKHPSGVVVELLGCTFSTLYLNAHLGVEDRCSRGRLHLRAKRRLPRQCAAVMRRRRGLALAEYA